MFHRITTTAAALALAACASEPPAAAQPGASESHVLCLADPGDAPAATRDAIRDAQRAADRLADRADVWVRIGRAWVRHARLTGDGGWYLNVAACADEALARDSAHAPALMLRGLALLDAHRFDDAAAVFGTLVARDPDDPQAWGGLSDALLELGRYDDAAAAAQRQMELAPGMAAHARGSYFRWLAGDTAGAKIFVRDALLGRDARDPEPAAWTFVEAGHLYWHAGDHAGADALYAEALRWVTQHHGALVGRGRAALARGDADGAIVHLDAAHRARPGVETAWLLADAYALAGDTERAAQLDVEAVRLGRRGDPLTLAQFLAARNRDADEALALADAEAATRGGIYVDDARAFALYRAGRLDEARAASDRALRLGTPDARLLFHAGAIRLAGGDTQEGRALLERALALNPDFDVAGAAEARLLLAAAQARRED